MKVGSVALAPEDYEVAYQSNTNAGTATVIVTGVGNYIGSSKQSFTIAKANNPLIAKAKKSKLTNKARKLKKKAKKVANLKVSQGKGALRFANVSKKAAVKKWKVSSSGVLKVPKKVKPGKHKVRIQITVMGDANYKSTSKVVAFTVKVK